MRLSPYRGLIAALALTSTSTAVGLAFTDETVPVGSWVLLVIWPPALAMLGRRHVRGALWLLLTISVIGAAAQLVPPIETWRLGLLILDGFAIGFIIVALKSRTRPSDPAGGGLRQAG